MYKPTQSELQTMSLLYKGGTIAYVANKRHVLQSSVKSTWCRLKYLLNCIDKDSVFLKLVEIGALFENGDVNYDYIYPSLKES